MKYLVCRKLDELGDCIQNYWTDTCKRSGIESYLRRNIHSIGLAHLGYVPGRFAGVADSHSDHAGPMMPDMTSAPEEPPEFGYLRNWDPYMCDRK